MRAILGRPALATLSRPTILLTGFRPYGGERINASQVLIAALKRTTPTRKQAISIRYAILPADPQQLETTLPVLLKRHQPDTVVLLGQAPGRNQICLEQEARNDFQGQPIRPDGPAVCRATLPGQSRIIRALRQAEIPAALSKDAGDYLCNMALYLALMHARETGTHMRVGFVHVPVLPRQVINFWSDAPCMTLDTLHQAARVILSVLTDHKRIKSRRPYSK